MTLPAFIPTIGRPPKRPPAALVRELVHGIAEMAGVTAADIYSRDRHQAVSWARAMVCRWLRAHESGYSTTGIGHALGLDHTSVLHASKRELSPMSPYAVKVKRQSYPRLGRRIQALVNSRKQIRVREMADILNAPSNNISEAVSKLLKRGLVRRLGMGLYGPIPSPRVAVVIPFVAPPPPVAFIRPISKERMMAGR